MEQVKLLSMTIVLTALIWTSADRLINEAVTVDVSFKPVSAAGPNLLLSSDPLVEAYQLEVSGPRKIVESFKAQSPVEIPLRLTDRPTGSTQLPLDRAMIKRELAERWREYGKLTVVSVQPEVLPVTFDHLITREVEIVLSRLTLPYDIEPQLGTATTTVRMRESQLGKYADGQPIQLDISTEVENILREQPAGQNLTVPVTLDTRAFGPGVSFDPASISITATVKAQRRTASIPTVPILVAVSFANLEKPFRVVSADGSPLSLVTQTVSVTGPTEAVARLQRGSTRAYGIVQLKEEDLEQLNTPKLMTPEFHLPEGVELAEIPTPIEFKLIDASSTESGN